MDNYFIRNNRYRSTIQASNPALMSPSSRMAPVTPVFRSRYSSQTSVNSTNPFDDDYLDTMSTIESPVRRSARKKRRAPQPPSISPTSQSVSYLTVFFFTTPGQFEIIKFRVLCAANILNSVDK